MAVSRLAATATSSFPTARLLALSVLCGPMVGEPSFELAGFELPVRRRYSIVDLELLGLAHSGVLPPASFRDRLSSASCSSSRSSSAMMASWAARRSSSLWYLMGLARASAKSVRLVTGVRRLGVRILQSPVGHVVSYCDVDEEGGKVEGLAYL